MPAGGPQERGHVFGRDEQLQATDRARGAVRGRRGVAGHLEGDGAGAEQVARPAQRRGRRLALPRRAHSDFPCTYGASARLNAAQAAVTRGRSRDMDRKGFTRCGRNG